MTADIHPIVEDGIQGFLHLPAGAALGSVVLTHGASASSNTPLLKSIAEAFYESGWSVLRFDLPFRQRRPKGPPGRGDAERDRQGLAAAIAYMKSRVAGRAFVGGHSYGGRQSSMLVSEAPDTVDGLLLLAYPLHAPGRADQPRIAHLGGVRKPALFVHGTRDPFGTIEEMQGALALVPARTELMVIDGAGHDLGGAWDKHRIPAFFAS